MTTIERVRQDNGLMGLARKHALPMALMLSVATVTPSYAQTANTPDTPQGLANVVETYKAISETIRKQREAMSPEARAKMDAEAAKWIIHLERPPEALNKVYKVIAVAVTAAHANGTLGDRLINTIVTPDSNLSEVSIRSTTGNATNILANGVIEPLSLTIDIEGKVGYDRYIGDYIVSKDLSTVFRFSDYGNKEARPSIPKLQDFADIARAAIKTTGGEIPKDTLTIKGVAFGDDKIADIVMGSASADTKFLNTDTKRLEPLGFVAVHYAPGMHAFINREQVTVFFYYTNGGANIIVDRISPLPEGVE